MVVEELVKIIVIVACSYVEEKTNGRSSLEGLFQF